jgi:hypothetical protein
MLVQITSQRIIVESYLPDVVHTRASKKEFLQVVKRAFIDPSDVTVDWSYHTVDNTAQHCYDMRVSVWKRYKMVNRTTRAKDENGNFIVIDTVLLFSRSDIGHPVMPTPKYEFIAAGMDWSDIRRIVPTPTLVSVRI